METQTRRKRAMASVYVVSDDCPFIVAETPREVGEMVRNASADALIELTLANSGGWNGKPLLVRADKVVAVSPPKDEPDEDDDE